MIGTLTVHFNSNYGANLQAYALRAFLEARCNEPVRVIDYRNDRIRNLYAFRPWDFHSRWPFVSLNLESVKRFVKILLNIDGTLIRDMKFASFRKKHMPMTCVVHDTESIRKLGCSLIVVGSDQIWNDRITGDRENAFWGAVKTSRTFVASYAPSFGRAAITDREQSNIAAHVANFDYLTVREPSMIPLLAPHTEKQIHVACDPVFLLDRAEWEKHTHPVGKRHLLVYLIERNPVLLEMAKAAADALSLEIVVLSSGKPYSPKIGRYIKTAPPFEFLSWFSGADFVLTNSFHGTAFALLFNKPFVTLPDTKNPARMLELLARCNLSSRICLAPSQMTKEFLSAPLDFSEANAAILKMKEESVACLDEILRLASELNP